MKVGLIGLGNMGGRIAQRLIDQGHDLLVHDVNPEAVKKFEALQAKDIKTLPKLAELCDVIITVLPNANIVKDVVLGKSGLLTGLKQGSLLIDMTSSDPVVTKEVGGLLKERQVGMLDAPVSGGVKNAEIGRLSIMVGGEKSYFERALHLFQDIGETITHVGELGAGHTIKALNNLLCAATLAITSEVMTIGIKMGLDPEKMLEVINSSSGRSHASEVKFPQQVLSRKFEVGFTIDLMRKDVNTALEMAKYNGLELELAQSVSKLWDSAVEQGAGQMDHTAIAKYVESLTGVEIKNTQSKKWSVR